MYKVWLCPLGRSDEAGFMLYEGGNGAKASGAYIAAVKWIEEQKLPLYVCYEPMGKNVN